MLPARIDSGSPVSVSAPLNDPPASVTSEVVRTIRTDPRALEIAVAAASAVEHVGMPECAYALSQAAIYLSLAPKSDAVKRAIGEARSHIRERGAGLPPAALRSAAYPAAARLGRGVGYRYPHDEPGHVNDQEHLPEGLEGLRFYLPDEAEGELRERLAELRRARGRRA